MHCKVYGRVGPVALCVWRTRCGGKAYFAPGTPHALR
jgi:hypothetical protein